MRDVAVKANMHFDTFEQAHLNKYANKIDISIGLGSTMLQYLMENDIDL